MTREELVASLEAYGLAARRDEILAAAQPCVTYSSVRDKSRPCAVGASKLGGDPDMPPAAPWPEEDDCNLYFMAQLNLAEAPLGADSGLPPRGLLLFFYDMENQPWGFDPKDRSGHRVIYVEDAAELERRTPPEAIEFDDGVLECHLVPEASYSLPPAHTLDCSDEEFDDYFELYELTARHQLLGLPKLVQNPMERECQLASHGIYVGGPEGYRSEEAKALLAGADDWRLLFQFTTDDSAGAMWGDCGTIYYWIRKQDLAARRFDQTWLVLQCY